MKVNNILKNLSDDKLLVLVEEIKNPVFPEDALIRKVILDAFGEINILALQINELLWPLLEVISERFKCDSPHIQK